MPIVLIVILASLIFTSDAHAQITGSQKKKVQLRGKKEKREKQKDIVYSGKSESKTVKISNQKIRPVIIDWIRPTPGDLKLTGDMLDISLKIIAPQMVKKENIVILHNQQVAGSKMDVAGLYGDQKEFTYNNQVALTEGVNEIIVHVTTNEGTKTSRPVVVRKQGKVISMDVMGASADPKSHTSVYWWTSYDPVALGGKPYISKEKKLPVKFKIITTVDLYAIGYKLILNNKPVAQLNKGALIRDSQGNYTFEDEVTLEELEGSNEIYLEVGTTDQPVRSEKLFVNYTPFRPNLHVLAIGTETNLQYTVKDARDFARLFLNQGGQDGNKLFNKINIDTLIGPRATAQEIKGTIEEFKVRYFTGTISAEDILVTFISSHGFVLNDEFRVQGNDYSPLRQLSTSVSFRHELVNILEAIPCKKIIMIDACHSGGARANPADINFEINKLNSIKNGLSVFASSRGEEQSYEDVKWQNGAFTSALIKALNEGKADHDKNGIISLNELQQYVTGEVATMVKTVKNRPQNPVVINDELADVSIYVIQ